MIPGSANPLLLATAAGAGGYEIERSLRFNSSDSAYLSRTPASAGNRKTWTWAGWVKRSAISRTGANSLFGRFTDGDNHTVLRFDNTDKLDIRFTTSQTVYQLDSDAVFRDASAWYHIVVACDTTQGTAADRVKAYANGSQLTLSGTPWPFNGDTFINITGQHEIGNLVGVSTAYLDGYLADVHFIDSQALDPSSFGEFDDNGVWQPIAYAGSYGTNGFRLDFSDNSAATATTLGKDRAGSNNWTPNNLSVTAGAGNDSLVDTPTSYGTDTGAGGSVRGNYCTLNPLDNGGITLANGNLDGSRTTASWVTARGAIGISSDKWYWEVLCTASTTGQGLMPGVVNAAGSLSTFVGNNARGYGYNWDANKYNSGTGTSYGATFTNGDLIGIAFDATAGSLTFYKNGASQGVAYTGIPVDTYFPAVSMVGTMSASANFGQRPFAYTAPSGFKALCTTNLPEPTIADGSTAMDVVTYTGNGSTQTISGLGFSPDLVWIKNRTDSAAHRLLDTIRGATEVLYSDFTDAETTESTSLTAFNSDGFAVGSENGVNGLSDAIVAWAWDAGSSTVTNTQGSITSSVRTNNYLSIVTYTGTGSAATVGHGLGVAPGLIILKDRTSGAYNWQVYHSTFAGTSNSIVLNSTAAVDSGSGGVWNSTAPTSTVFSIGTSVGVNTNGDNYVAYCFSPVAGYSSFGSYVGGSNPFVYLGFRPRFILFKATSAGNWDIYDSSRTPYNESNLTLAPNLSGAEYNAGSLGIDLLSNGFKLDGGQNVSTTYIYAAFAENPFQYARAR